MTYETEAAPNEQMNFAQCEQLASQLLKADELPVECRTNYPQLIRSILDRRNSKRTDPFEGMWANDALHARHARANGKETQAHIQRRLTSTDPRK